MQVKELIAKLNEFDPEAIVTAEADNGMSPYDVSTVFKQPETAFHKNEVTIG